jgi:peroxiredoxin family protein
MTLEKETNSGQRLTILLHSGSYDKATNALSLAIVGLSMGMEVYVLVTYEALRRFKKGYLEDSMYTDPELLGMMQKGIDDGKFHTIEEKLEMAHAMGMKLYACTTAMETIGAAREDLVAEVDDIMGLTAFMRLAVGAAVNWYI